jgi:hypothetical protein
MLAATETPLSDTVSARPIHRLEGIITMQQHTLEQAVNHRKDFETQKDANLKAIEEIYREDINRCDNKITTLTDSLILLQQEKQRLHDGLEKRRQEIIDQFKADDEALMKIIKAQRLVITALGESEESHGTGSRPNGFTKPDRGSDKKQETGQTEQRPN